MPSDLNERSEDIAKDSQNGAATKPAPAMSEAEYKEWLYGHVAGRVWRRLAAVFSALGLLGIGGAVTLLSDQINNRIDSAVETRINDLQDQIQSLARETVAMTLLEFPDLSDDLQDRALATLRQQAPLLTERVLNDREYLERIVGEVQRAVSSDEIVFNVIASQLHLSLDDIDDDGRRAMVLTMISLLDNELDRVLSTLLSVIDRWDLSKDPQTLSVALREYGSRISAVDANDRIQFVNMMLARLQPSRIAPPVDGAIIDALSQFRDSQSSELLHDWISDNPGNSNTPIVLAVLARMGSESSLQALTELAISEDQLLSSHGWAGIGLIDQDASYPLAERHLAFTRLWSAIEDDVLEGTISWESDHEAIEAQMQRIYRALYRNNVQELNRLFSEQTIAREEVFGDLRQTLDSAGREVFLEALPTPLDALSYFGVAHDSSVVNIEFDALRNMVRPTLELEWDRLFAPIMGRSEVMEEPTIVSYLTQMWVIRLADELAHIDDGGSYRIDITNSYLQILEYVAQGAGGSSLPHLARIMPDGMMQEFSEHLVSNFDNQNQYKDDPNNWIWLSETLQIIAQRDEGLFSNIVHSLSERSELNPVLVSAMLDTAINVLHPVQHNNRLHSVGSEHQSDALLISSWIAQRRNPEDWSDESLVTSLIEFLVYHDALQQHEVIISMLSSSVDERIREHIDLFESEGVSSSHLEEILRVLESNEIFSMENAYELSENPRSDTSSIDESSSEIFRGFLVGESGSLSGGMGAYILVRPGTYVVEERDGVLINASYIGAETVTEFSDYSASSEAGSRVWLFGPEDREWPVSIIVSSTDSSTAIRLDVGNRVSGAYGTGGAAWYELEVQNGVTYEISTSNLRARADTVIEIFSSDDSEAALDWNDDSERSGDEIYASRLRWRSSFDGSILIRVSDYYDQSGQFEISVE